MAAINTTQYAVNQENGTYLSVQVFMYLESDTWDWANTSSDGRDLRLTLTFGGTVLKFWIATWDQANQYAVIAVLLPSLPPGETYINCVGGDLTLTTQSDYNGTMQPGATDEDVYIHVAMNEGSGTVLNGAGGRINGALGTFNGTWNGGPIAQFGRGNVSASFSTGNAIVLNGTSQYAKFPNILQGGAQNGLDIPHEGTFSATIQQTAVNGGNRCVFAIQRFGLIPLYLVWAGNNTIQVNFDTGASGQFCNLTSGVEILGPANATYTGAALLSHKVALSYGGDGVRFYVDGQLQDCARNIVNRYRPIGANGVAAGLFIGAFSSDGATGDVNTFSAMKVQEFCFHSRQLTPSQINMMAHHMKVYPVKTASDRLRRIGVVLSPDQGSAFNSNQWSEPIEFNDQGFAGRKVLYSRGGVPAGDVGVICCVKKSQGMWYDPASLIKLIGANNGGETQSALCPAYTYRNGIHYLCYAVHDFATTMALASATDATGPYTKLGNMTFPGYAGGFGNKHIWFDAAGVLNIILEGTPAWTLYKGTINLTTRVCTLDLVPLACFKTNPNGDASGPQLTFPSDGRIHALFHSGTQSAIYHRDGKTLRSMLWGPYDMILDFDPNMLIPWSAGQIQVQTGDGDMSEQIATATGAQSTEIVYSANTGGGGTVAAVCRAEANLGITDLFKPSIRIDSKPGGAFLNVPIANVNSDTGGVDNLRVETSDGAGGFTGVFGATVAVYLTSEYNVNPNTAVIRGHSVTDANGRWGSGYTSMLVDLSVGYTYTVIAFKDNNQPATMSLTL